MKHNLDCRIVEDLLPSYLDGVTCEFTNEAIEEHMQECQACSMMLQRMREPEQHKNTGEMEVDYLKKIRGRVSKAFIISGVSVVVLILGILVGIFLYNRIVPKKFVEIFPKTEISEMLISHSISDAELELTDVECQTFYSLLEKADYYYNGRQGSVTAVQGDGYNVVSFDAGGSKIFEFCITNEYYVYADNKVYDVRKDEEIIDFIELRIVSEPEWIEWEKEIYSSVDGVYVIEGEEDLGFLNARIWFDLEEHTCIIPQSIVSSVYPGGTFHIKDDKIIAKDIGNNTYIFEIVDDETIRFIQEGSSEISLGDGRSLPDGTVFKLVEE